MTNGTNGNGNGAVRKALIAILGSVVATLSVAAVLAVVSVRDRVNQLESSWAVGDGAKGLVEQRHAIDRLDGRVTSLEEWRGQGQRFTKDDGEHQRALLQEQINKLRADLDELSREQRRRAKD